MEANCWILSPILALGDEQGEAEADRAAADDEEETAVKGL
jgi:hypothetical protein